MAVTYQDSNARMSQVAVHNQTVYLAGQVPQDASADMKGQTEQKQNTPRPNSTSAADPTLRQPLANSMNLRVSSFCAWSVR